MSAGIMEFEQALLKILSNNSADRQQGEFFISCLEKNQNFHLFLIAGLSFSNQLACLSGILFRQKIVKTRKFWDLNKSQQNEAKTSILASVNPHQQPNLLKIIASIMVPLFQIEENLEEAFNFLVFAKDNLKIDFFLFLVENFIKTWPLFLEGSRKQLCMFLWEKIQLESTEVLVCQLLCETCSEDQLVSSVFSDKLLEVIEKHGKISDVSDLLANILTLMEKNSKVLQDRLEDFINILILTSSNENCQISKVASIDVLCRLLTPDVSFKTSQNLLVFAFKLLSEVEYFSDLAAWGSDIQDFEAVRNDNISLSKDLLLTLLLNQSCHSSYLELAEAHLRSGHWVYQQAGTLSLGFYCLEVKKFHSLYFSVVPFIQSTNPRLRWAALRAIDCFLHEYPEKFSFTFDIWKELQLGLISDLENLAISAIETSIILLNVLTRNPLLESGDMTSFMRSVFEVFHSPGVKTSVLLMLFELIPYIHEVKFELFEVYSSQFLTGFDSIIKSKLPSKIIEKATKTFALLCSKKIETTQYFCSSLFPLIGQNDEIENAIIESGPLFMIGLREKFSPYADFLFTVIIKNANISLKEFDENGRIEASFITNDNSKGRWCFNSVDFNKKIIALKTLKKLAKLGIAFQPYAEETLRVVEGLKNFTKSRQISKCAQRIVRYINRINTNQEIGRKELMVN